MTVPVVVTTLPLEEIVAPVEVVEVVVVPLVAYAAKVGSLFTVLVIIIGA
jgi:hypothetical protein